MKNKVLAMLLALCMVMSLLPMTVFASGETVTRAQMGSVEASEGTIVKGGDNDNPTYSRTKIVISGEDPHGESECKAQNCTCGATLETASTTPTESYTDSENNTTNVTVNLTTKTYTWGQLCSACDDAGCTDGEGGEGGTGDGEEAPTYCSCTGEQAGCTSATHTRGDENGCTNTVDEDGICPICDVNIKNAQAEAEAAARDCGGENNNQGTDKCTNKEHESSCPKACGAGQECTLTKDHTGDHNNTHCLGGAANCGAKEHDSVQCSKYVPEASAGMDATKGYVELTATVDCGCAATSHEHTDYEGEGQHAATVDVTVKFYFEYEWPILDNDLKPLSAAAIAVLKQEAYETKKATYEGNNPTAEDMPDTNALSSMVAEEDAICAFCKAANKAAADAAAAEEEATIKENLAKCTGAVSCEAGDKPEYHNDDCLSQCTMDSDCENTVGDAAAHRIKYQVYKTTYEVTYEGQNVTKSVRKGTAPEGVAWENLEDAQNYKIGLVANNGDPDQDGKREEYGYSIRAIHCPQAKVPDGVVVNEAGEVVEAPAETPEKPTKAEDFTDMEDWMAEGVQFMLDKGWMEGLGDGKFGGRDDLKTTMVLTVLARMNGETITGSTWADDAKAWAEKNAEFFEGIDLENDNMARKDVVLVLWRQAGKPEPSADFELEFTDVEGLEGDHLTAMKWAVENKIVLGNGDGTVSPDGNINRSALSLLVMRADAASK